MTKLKYRGTVTTLYPLQCGINKRDGYEIASKI